MAKYQEVANYREYTLVRRAFLMAAAVLNHFASDPNDAFPSTITSYENDLKIEANTSGLNIDVPLLKFYSSQEFQ